MISTSEMKIAVTVDETRIEDAARAVHHAAQFEKVPCEWQPPFGWPYARRDGLGELRDLQMPVITGTGAGDSGLDVAGEGENPAEVVGGKLKDGEAPACEILLIAEILIRGDKEVEFLLCQTN